MVGISDPTKPTLLVAIPIRPSISDSMVAVAVDANVKTNPGRVVFFDTDGSYIIAVTEAAGEKNRSSNGSPQRQSGVDSNRPGSRS